VRAAQPPGGIRPVFFSVDCDHDGAEALPGLVADPGRFPGQPG